MAPTGLVIIAWKRGFCRKIAESRVDPDRGRPEMKWIPFCIECAPFAARRASASHPISWPILANSLPVSNRRRRAIAQLQWAQNCRSTLAGSSCDLLDPHRATGDCRFALHPGALWQDGQPPLIRPILPRSEDSKKRIHNEEET